MEDDECPKIVERLLKSWLILNEWAVQKGTPIIFAGPIRINVRRLASILQAPSEKYKQ